MTLTRNTVTLTAKRQHVKSGSIATGNLADMDQCCESPQHATAARGARCSLATEENRRLVVCYSNGTGKSRSHRSHLLQFSFLPLRALQVGPERP
uniref:Uncharacterized protein n=1 Tax=Knipowitschia caucasica TaxID=637954 RepID=A0AAV2LIF4_KNICA